MSAGLEAARAVAALVVAGVDPHPDLEHGGREPGQIELAVVGVALAGVALPVDGHPGVVGGGEDLALDRRANAWLGRAQVEALAAADHVDREREAEVLGPALRSSRS